MIRRLLNVLLAALADTGENPPRPGPLAAFTYWPDRQEDRNVND